MIKKRIRVSVDNVMNDVKPIGRYFRRSSIEKLWAGHDELTLTDICDLGIPMFDTADIVTSFLSARSNRLFVCDCAESILPIWTSEYPDDSRLEDGINITRLYMDQRVAYSKLKAARRAVSKARTLAFRISNNSKSAMTSAAAYVAETVDLAIGTNRCTRYDAVWGSRRGLGAFKLTQSNRTYDVESQKQRQLLRKYCELE